MTTTTICAAIYWAIGGGLVRVWSRPHREGRATPVALWVWGLAWLLWPAALGLWLGMLARVLRQMLLGTEWVNRRVTSPPCANCRHLRRDIATLYGVSCGKGDTSDQCGDFSCFERVKGTDNA